MAVIDILCEIRDLVFTKCNYVPPTVDPDPVDPPEYCTQREDCPMRCASTPWPAGEELRLFDCTPEGGAAYLGAYNEAGQLVESETFVQLMLDKTHSCSNKKYAPFLKQAVDTYGPALPAPGTPGVWGPWNILKSGQNQYETNNFTAAFDFSGVSFVHTVAPGHPVNPDESGENVAGGQVRTRNGTQIARDAAADRSVCLVAKHWMTPVGGVIHFLSQANVVSSHTVLAQVGHPQNDIGLLLVEPALPADHAVYPTLEPTVTACELVGLPILVTKDRNSTTWGPTNSPQNPAYNDFEPGAVFHRIRNYTNTSAFSSFSTDTKNETELPYGTAKNVILYDSSNPNFLVDTDGKMIVLGTWHVVGAFPPVFQPQNHAWIQSQIQNTWGLNASFQTVPL